MAFESMPKMELDIEPIVGSRQIIWNPILRVIESRIREVIAETIVLPHWDDTPFTDTLSQLFRGGIWEEQLKANGHRAKKESSVEKGIVDDVDKDMGLEEEGLEYQMGSSLRQANERTTSMPVISQSPTALDKQKSASIIGLSEPPDSPRGLARSPSLRSTHGERKTKSHRAQSLTAISPPSPSVITDAVNVTAVRGKGDVGDKGVTSAVMAMSRSRSSSTPHSPSGTQPTSPTGPRFSTGSLAPDALADNTSAKSSYSSVNSFEGRTDEVVSRPRGPKPSPSPTRSISGGSTKSLASTASAPNPPDLNSNPTNQSMITKALHEKPSFAAVASATAAVRNWYKTRNTNGEGGSSSSMEISSKPPAPRNLPPVTIPPPVAKKTPPINVPKRKTLPPPLLPARNQGRATPAPPIPPRDLSPFGGGTDQLLVVAAPDSEPPSPSPTVEGEDGDYLRRNGTYNGSVESHLMFPSPSRDSESSSSISPNLPRRSRSIRTSNGEVDREREHERAVRKEKEAEREVWHAAEEAELRTKVPWEPDESLT